MVWPSDTAGQLVLVAKLLGFIASMIFAYCAIRKQRWSVLQKALEQIRFKNSNLDHQRRNALQALLDQNSRLDRKDLILFQLALGLLACSFLLDLLSYLKVFQFD